MKRLALAGTLTTLLALTLAFSACGGDDDSDSSGDSSSNIRTQQGLAVANLVAGLSGGTDSGFLAPGAAVSEAGDDGDVSSRSADQSSVSDGVAGYGWAPALQTGGGTGITAFGYGSATADADSALIDFYFYSYGGGVIEPQPVPEPGTVAPDGSGSAPDVKPTFAAGEVTPITEADLQPVIDALTAAGADNVEFIGQPYYDIYSSSATLRATVNNIDNVDAIVQAGTDAGNNLGGAITFSGNNVSYTIQDCAALEAAAMSAAVDDAHDRAGALAGVLAVTLGSVIGASDSSYSPYGSAPCSSSYYGGPIPLYDTRSATGAEGIAGPGEVQVFSSVSVTYAIN